MSNKTIEFLHRAANALPTANRTQLLLKAFYLTRTSAHVTGLGLGPAAAQRPVVDDAAACRKCRTNWHDKRMQLSVRPGSRRSRRVRLLVQRNESDECLSVAERIRAKKCLKAISSVVKSTCPLCRTQRRTLIRHQDPVTAAGPPKKRKNKAPPIVAPLPDPHKAIDLATVQLVTKKKKKSDINAGLIIPTKFAQPTKPETKLVLVPAEISHTSSTTTKSAPKQPQPPKQQQQSLAMLPKQKSHKAGGGKAKPAKGKPAKLSASEKRAADAKQRNSMLLLANVLKMKDQPATKRPSGLEAMLRK